MKRPETLVLIAGLGGVGGYFGGQLARHFRHSETVGVAFLARGEHLKQIRQNGLKIIQGGQETVAKPWLATDQPAEIGKVDFILLCTKTYDLAALLVQLAPCVGPETVLIPLQNGVNSRKTIQAIYPGNLVTEGCVYLLARLKEAGVVENSGNIHSLYFGMDGPENDRLRQLEGLLRAAGLEATYVTLISTVIWEKFIFLSPLATATSWFDAGIGTVLATANSNETILALLDEVIQLARAKQIDLPADIRAKTLAKLTSMPFEATSSMHSDFSKQKSETELEALTGYVIREGAPFHLKAPTYERAYQALQRKMGR